MTNARRVHALILCFAAILFGAIYPVLAASQKDEEKAGREYAESIEKELTIINDPAFTERVERVGQAIAKIAKEHEVNASYGESKIYDFNYKFKVVDSKDVNAFALPGGYIYVNTGLLEMVQSDDELAGVLAHEVAHIAHHHTSRLMREQSKMNKLVALVALAGIFGKVRNRDLNNLLMGAQMMQVGTTSGRTMEAERDADRTAVAYLAKSTYKAEGLMAFMKKLEEKHAENPTLPLGIYQTHPSPFRRVDAVVDAMIAEGLSPNVRQLRGVAYAKATPAEDNSDQYKVVICDRDVCIPASLSDGPTSKQRAEEIAKRINNMLDSGITARDIAENTASSCLVAGNVEIFKVEPEDVKIQKKADQTILAEARSALKRAAWADWLSNECIATRQPMVATSN
ncbi:MAG: M48 family metalloprotease [Armatimonadota bacterium]|nr:M48 family metalloprotease [bacterium]